METCLLTDLSATSITCIAVPLISVKPRGFNPEVIVSKIGYFYILKGQSNVQLQNK